MNRSEVAKLLALATANFPSYQERDMRPTLILWEKMLADLPADLAEAALIKVLSTAKFFPTVAEIREAAMELSGPRMPSAMEAWAEVSDAMHRYGFYRESEALAALSPPVAQMVRRFGWRELCMSEEPEIVRGQWRRAWDEHVKNERQTGVLPARLREMITGIVEAKQLKQ